MPDTAEICPGILHYSVINENIISISMF